jgi:hypothetical protein
MATGIALQDYAHALRRNLNYSQIQSLISSIEEIEPGFAEEPLFSQQSASTLLLTAYRLGIQLKRAPLAGNGLSLFGFYLPTRSAVRRNVGLPVDERRQPMIFLNIAHHPLAVAGTFHHELGHHFTEHTLHRQKGLIHQFDVDFAEHLDDPFELAADIAVSLYFYPHKIAAKFFRPRSGSGRIQEGIEIDAGTLYRIFKFLKDSYGFDLRVILRQPGKSDYLLGAIHYIKLRRALLAEYGV